MQLKKYQKNSIEKLREYLKEVQKDGPKKAFNNITSEDAPKYKESFFGYVPFICMKIPTGGGKTLVGCHALPEIFNTVLKNKMERGIVLWFTPSEAIKTQTLRKFKDRTDWHRQALDEAFDNKVIVFSNEEALRIRKGDVENNICIIIASLEAFRKDKSLQKKYKVYKENGELLSHFENIKDDSNLEKDSEGTIINSLANVVRMDSPLVVIDEGHKTQTKLSIDFIKDLNPSLIIEYTATPREGSNILINVFASDLKDEQMVKIPIVLESAVQWENALDRGIKKRADLEKETNKNKKEYIRPIVLIQAQPESKISKHVTVDVVKEYLLKTKIKEEEIAIKISGKNELEGVDLLSRKCPVKYIITVNALAEGWDCSFAYVLVSLANVGAKIAVEQIIGRILRMPYAKRKENEELNRSYIFASAKNFNEAAETIISGLEDNGYSRSDFIDGTKKEQKYELEVERAFKKDLAVPMVSYGGEKLSFEDLIGEDFELSKQDHKFDFEVHYDNDGQAIIDIKKENEWIRESQKSLNLIYQDRNVTEAELAQWLDKRLRFTQIERKEKVVFIEKALEYQLSTRKRTLTELSVNRYLLSDKLHDVIESILENYGKKRFDEFMKKGKITTKALDKFPTTITISQEIPQTFNKSYYKKIDKLNSEEKNFIERLDLDTLPNVDFWVRNREKKDPFYIQGWQRNKFYPDFVAVTKKGNIIALEWKGEDRVSNEDTEYKEAAAQVWEKLGKGKLHFFLVYNKNIDEILIKIKDL